MKYKIVTKIKNIAIANNSLPGRFDNTHIIASADITGIVCPPGNLNEPCSDLFEVLNRMTETTTPR